MADNKPSLAKPIEDVVPMKDSDNTTESIAVDTEEELDADEQEFRAMRRDLHGVKGASAAGIVAISVGKMPTKNEFFRTHRDFGRSCRSLTIEVGMERQFFAVTPDMVESLDGIGITRGRPRAVSDDHIARRLPHRAGAAGQC